MTGDAGDGLTAVSRNPYVRARLRDFTESVPNPSHASPSRHPTSPNDPDTTKNSPRSPGNHMDTRAPVQPTTDPANTSQRHQCDTVRQSKKDRVQPVTPDTPDTLKKAGTPKWGHGA